MNFGIHVGNKGGHSGKRDSGDQTTARIVIKEYKKSSNSKSGYESAGESVDPKSFAFFNEVAQQVQSKLMRRVEKNGFCARRFKKFPRFSIYVQRDKSFSHLESKYVSLNKRLSSLREEDAEIEQIMHLHSVDSIESLEAAKIECEATNIGPTHESIQEPSKLDQGTVHLQKDISSTAFDEVSQDAIIAASNLHTQ